MKRLAKFLLVMTIVSAHGADQQQLEAIINGIDTPYDELIPFVEKRQSKLLKEPLILFGNMLFTTDGRISKQVERPDKERVTISAFEAEFERGGKVRRLPLKKQPGLRAFYTGMRSLLDGDAERLLDTFSITVEDSGEAWRISLEPKDSSLEKFVRQLTISGRGARVLTVRTDQPGGDWQELSFNEAVN